MPLDELTVMLPELVVRVMAVRWPARLISQRHPIAAAFLAVFLDGAEQLFDCVPLHVKRLQGRVRPACAVTKAPRLATSRVLPTQFPI
jgi:hypothetical protein